MTRPIELFSLEGVVLRLFGAIVFLSGVLEFALMVVPARSRFRPWAVVSVRTLDRFFRAFYRSAKLIPWILAALLISVLAPVYDMHTDIGWADAVLRDGGDRVKGVTWTELLLNSHARTLPTFIHVAQTSIVLLVLWIYSISWNWMLRNSGRALTISRRRGGRWQFAAGFVTFVILPISALLNYIGKHAELVLQLPFAQ